MKGFVNLFGKTAFMDVEEEQHRDVLADAMEGSFRRD